TRGGAGKSGDGSVRLRRAGACEAATAPLSFLHADGLGRRTPRTAAGGAPSFSVLILRGGGSQPTPLPRQRLHALPVDDSPHPLGTEEVRPPARVEVRPPELLDGRL